MSYFRLFSCVYIVDLYQLTFISILILTGAPHCGDLFVYKKINCFNFSFLIWNIFVKVEAVLFCNSRKDDMPKKHLNLKNFLFVTLPFFFLFSCNQIPNTRDTNVRPDNEFRLPIVKAGFETKAVQPQLLHFESKVIPQSLSTISTLPTTTFNEFHMKVNGSPKNIVKIPVSGTFKIIFETGSTFQYIDSDATDGEAIIQIPSGFFDGYMRVIRDIHDRTGTPQITIEDSLYYIKQDIIDLNTNGKNTVDSWYHLGKRALPIFPNWYNNDGTKYILNFTNSGVKDLAFRWYNNNQTEFDYPLGIREITPSGGIVELPGVGKLDIPEGALSQTTTIVMKQELEAYEVFPYRKTQEQKRLEDFVSPIVRIEPMGLELNKPALINLETDLVRVGNNHPSLINWFISSDKLIWNTLELKNYSIELSKGFNAYNYPILIYKLEFASKQFPADIEPNAGYRFLDSEKKGLNIQSENQTTNTFDCSSAFYIQYPENYAQDIASSEARALKIQDRLIKACEYFIQVSDGNTPYVWPSFKFDTNGPVITNQIPVKIDKKIGCKSVAPAFGLPNDKLATTLTLTSEDFGAEHELWHDFVQSKYTGTILDKYPWIEESSATHMGARAYKKYIEENGKLPYSNPTCNDEFAYRGFLNSNLDNLSASMPLPILPPSNSLPHSRPGFFTFLTNVQTNPDSDKIIIKVFEDVPNNLHLEKFHDYSIHSYLEDRFDIYLPGTFDSSGNFTQKYIQPNPINLGTGNDKLHPITRTPSFTLEGITYPYLANNAASYYNISASDPIASNGARAYVKTTSLSGSGCGNTKIKVLKYNTSDAKPNEFTEQQDLTIGGSWTEIGKFSTDFNHAVLIFSNTDETLNETNNCNYKLEAANEITRARTISGSLSSSSQLSFFKTDSFSTGASGLTFTYNITNYTFGTLPNGTNGITGAKLQVSVSHNYQEKEGTEIHFFQNNFGVVIPLTRDFSDTVNLRFKGGSPNTGRFFESYENHDSPSCGHQVREQFFNANIDTTVTNSNGNITVSLDNINTHSSNLEHTAGCGNPVTDSGYGLSGDITISDNVI